MNYRPALENEQTSRITDPAVQVIGIFVEFRTGDKRGAGTDAGVFLRVGQQTFPMPEQHGKDPFERGAVDRFVFPVDPPLPLAALRAAEIEVYHDSEGRNPGWQIAGIRLFVRLTGQTEPLLYKDWQDVGWLAVDEPPHATQVLLQQAG